MKNIYLDYAATTPLDPLVAKAMEPYWNKYYGNPSSLYKLGQESKKAIDKAKLDIAKILNCQADEIIFTGGGTESINLAIKGSLDNKKSHIIISAIEHPAVIESVSALKAQGHKVSVVKVDKYGLVNLKDIENSILPNTKLISIIMANNEIGTIQNIQSIGTLVEKINRNRKEKIYFHSDACQAAGYLDLNVKKLHVHLLSINGSKIYGPKGIGALYIKTGTKINALISGGGQEKNLRSGTENVPAIVGLATALKLANKSRTKETKRLTILRDKLIKDILKNIDNTELNGHPSKRLPNNVNVSIRGIEGETLLLYLDRLGIQVSTGSACSSHNLEASHVIKALGKNDKIAKSSIRLSLGKYTTATDLSYTLKQLIKTANQLR